jgi:hypothetical protein
MPDNTGAVYFRSTTTSHDHETVRETQSSFASTGTTALTESAGTAPPAQEVTDPVVAWQRTPGAARYRGRWVALDEASGRVIAAADSPADFDEQATRDATLVFVRPSGPPVER